MPSPASSPLPSPAAPVLGPSPLTARPGAVAAPDDGSWTAGLDAGLAWHYGDPLGEQRAADRGPILLDGWTACHLTVTGADRLSWLHTLTSQQLADLADGDATQALWLSPQGHVEHWAEVTDLGGTTHLRTEPGAGPALLTFLSSMVFWSKVDLADVTAAWAGLTVAGRGAADTVAAALGLPTTPASGRATAVPAGPAEGGWTRGHPDRLDVVVPRGRFGAVAAALIGAGATPAGSWAAAALRIPARRPRFGVDNDARTLPNEMPWLATAVHLHKGCYRGQETVARVDNLGQPPRRLVLLHLDGSADRLPVTGAPVPTAAGRAVGRVGTVAHHWEDGPIALALVKRTVGPGDALLVGGTTRAGRGADGAGDDGDDAAGGGTDDGVTDGGGVAAAIDPDDTVTAGRPFSVQRGTFHDFRRGTADRPRP